MKQFVENKDGVHLCSLNGYTLCGDALEGDTDIEPCGETRKRVVTCSRCIEVIQLCRGVHTKNVA